MLSLVENPYSCLNLAKSSLNHVDLSFPNTSWTKTKQMLEKRSTSLPWVSTMAGSMPRYKSRPMLPISTTTATGR